MSGKEIFRTSRPISIKLGTNHSCVKGILTCSNKGPGPFQREIITKMQKFGDIIENLSENTSYSDIVQYNSVICAVSKCLKSLKFENTCSIKDCFPY
jgi:hypothetical protein